MQLRFSNGNIGQNRSYLLIKLNESDLLNLGLR